MVVGRGFECRRQHFFQYFVRNLFVGEVADGPPLLQYFIKIHSNRFLSRTSCFRLQSYTALLSRICSIVSNNCRTFAFGSIQRLLWKIQPSPTNCRNGESFVFLYRPTDRNGDRSQAAPPRCLGVVLRRPRVREPDGGRHVAAFFGWRGALIPPGGSTAGPMRRTRRAMTGASAI